MMIQIVRNVRADTSSKILEERLIESLPIRRISLLIRQDDNLVKSVGLDRVTKCV